MADYSHRCAKNKWLTLGLLPWILRNNIPRFPFLSVPVKRCFLQVQAYRTAHCLIPHFEFGKKICQILPDSRPPWIPENEGSSPNISIIFLEEVFGEAGFSPPPVFLCESRNFENSFLAAPTIPRHFSLTSLTLRKQTPKEFTFPWYPPTLLSCFCSLVWRWIYFWLFQCFVPLLQRLPSIQQP